MTDTCSQTIIGGYNLCFDVRYMAIGIMLRGGKKNFLFLKMNNPECSISDIDRRLKRCFDIAEIDVWQVVGMLKQVNSGWVHRTYPEIYAAWMKIKSWDANYVLLIKKDL